MIRPLTEAKGFRASRVSMNPVWCSHSMWEQYGDQFWDIDADPPVNRSRVLLIVCSQCGRTPEEVTRPDA